MTIGILTSVSNEAFRKDVVRDPVVAARMFYSALVEQSDPPDRRVMRCASLLERLSVRIETDKILVPLYDAFVSISVELATKSSDLEQLTDQIKNFIEIKRLDWMAQFILRNRRVLGDLESSPVGAFMSALLICQSEMDAEIDRWCGRRVLAESVNFDAAGYLIENDDVRLSITLGGFRDALDHFNRCGRGEGRYQRVYLANV